ncbi:MAG: hypothetical protein ACERKR_08765, partial [Deltaproteobacteria bacterium]
MYLKTNLPVPFKALLVMLVFYLVNVLIPEGVVCAVDPEKKAAEKELKIEELKFYECLSVKLPEPKREYA